VQLTSPHCELKRYPTPADIAQAFQNVEQAALDDSPFLILTDVSDFCSGYIQAVHQEPGYWVEFRHGGTNRHYRLPDALPQEAALALFLEFRNVGIGVLDGHAWCDVTEEINQEIREQSLEK